MSSGQGITQVQDGIAFKVNAPIIASGTLPDRGTVLKIDASQAQGGALTATLPTAASMLGEMLILKRVDSSVNTLTIVGSGSDTIDGQATQNIIGLGSLIVISDGKAWSIAHQTPSVVSPLTVTGGAIGLQTSNLVGGSNVIVNSGTGVVVGTSPVTVAVSANPVFTSVTTGTLIVTGPIAGNFMQVQANSVGEPVFAVASTGNGFAYWFRSFSGGQRASIRAVPNGTVTNIPASIEVYNNDYFVSQSSFNRFSMRAAGNLNFHSILVDAGGGSTPSDLQIYISGASNGLYFAGPNNVGVGNIGIQTATPRRALDILVGGNVPQLRITSTDNSNYVEFMANQVGTLFINTIDSTINQQSLTNSFRSTYRLIPQSTGGLPTVAPATLELFGTDYIASTTNFERLSIKTRGSADPNYYSITSDAGGSGTARAIQIYVTGVNNGIRLDAAGTITSAGSHLGYAGTALAPTWSFSANPTYGMYQATATTIDFSIGNARKFIIAGTQLIYLVNGQITLGSSQDLVFNRDAAGILGVMNGANACTVRVYGTGTVYNALSHDGTNGFLIPSAGQLAFASAAGATTDTTGYECVDSCPGAPTGVPASIPSGQIPWRYDTANNKVWFYNAAWRGVAVA